MKKVFKISDEQIKEMYLNGSSLNDIAKVAQDTKGLMALRNRLHSLGVDTNVSQKKYRYKISKSCKRYTVNEHIFDSIDTEEKAYWLGFLLADGYNNETKCYVALRLQSADKEILEQFKQFLKTNAPIYTFEKMTKVNGLKRTYCELNIHSPIISEQLSKLGCIQNKTKSLKLPNIPECLYSHFLRGYFDGDGCFSVTKRNDRTENSLNYQFNITGMEEPLKTIQKHLIQNVGVTDNGLKSRKGTIAVTIHYSGKYICKKILDYLYKDATVYLKRKHDLYLKYCISAE